MNTLYNLAFYLPFGLAFVVPVDFLPVLGAAFLALAFVAILAVVFSPSHRSGTLSQIIVYSKRLDKCMCYFNLI